VSVLVLPLGAAVQQFVKGRLCVTRLMQHWLCDVWWVVCCILDCQCGGAAVAGVSRASAKHKWVLQANTKVLQTLASWR
jgi:hypothetical protein